MSPFDRCKTPLSRKRKATVKVMEQSLVETVLQRRQNRRLIGALGLVNILTHPKRLESISIPTNVPRIVAPIKDLRGMKRRSIRRIRRGAL